MKKFIQKYLKFLPLGLAMIFLAFLWISTAQGSQITNNPSSLNLGTVSSTNGNFTYTTTTVLSVTNTSTFEGFTQLGELSPGIKVDFATGTTAMSQGGTTIINFDSSITSEKLLGIIVMGDWTGYNAFLPPSYVSGSGYQLDWHTDGGFPIALTITNVAGNSGNILNVPFRVLIFYTQ